MGWYLRGVGLIQLFQGFVIDQKVYEQVDVLHVGVDHLGSQASVFEPCLEFVQDGLVGVGE